MTPRQKELVQATWEKVIPIAPTAAELFYRKLFELDPQLRLFFKSDLKDQGRKLMVMLTVAVRGLDHLDDLLPVVYQLGRRHGDYGVKDEDYDTVAAALLWTLQKGLDDIFTEEVEEAWATVYMDLAKAMKSAAKEARAPQEMPEAAS